MRVLLVDDHPIVVDALAMSLRLEGLDVEVSPDLDVTAIVGRAKATPPDVVLLDLDLGGSDSLPLVRPLTELGARVVMVTGEREAVRLGRCIEEGALGIVSKNVPFAKLQEAVLDAVGGRAVMPETEKLALLDAAAQWRREELARTVPFESLTKRERAVLGHLVDGRSADEIAASEFVSLATVRSQIQSILRKLQVNSQLAAVALAKQHRWSS
jgi:two-component system, NarL family, nitrate/nitrite response regulator NarL